MQKVLRGKNNVSEAETKVDEIPTLETQINKKYGDKITRIFGK